MKADEYVVLKILCLISQKIWNEEEIPEDYAQHYHPAAKEERSGKL